jgi:hypothetical protein
MAKPTQYELESRLNHVRKLLSEGKNGLEISEIIQVPYSTVQRYVHTVTERQKEKWDEIEGESLESRAIKIKSYYENIAKKAEAIIDKDDITAKELEIAGKLLIACHRNIYEMLRYGPLRFNSIPIKEIESKGLENDE